jgi:hypothetical protein
MAVAVAGSLEGMNSMAQYAQKILHFYCFTCKAYELKTSPHYRAQKQRFARRRRKEKKAQAEGQGQQTS